jgi:toxin FitB
VILLDTNVVSELMRETPDSRVASWIAAQKAPQLCLTAIAIAEIQRGLARLPRGKRRQPLEENFAAFIQAAFRGRVFAFDETAAYAYGQIAEQRERAGLNADAVDLMIAAIAKVQNAAIATRNVRDFEGCGIRIINPWKD